MNSKSIKTIVFLGNDYVFTEKEEEMIEKYSENQILVLTYSNIENKRGDVDKLRRDTGSSTEYRKIAEDESLTEIIGKINRDHDLCIDLTFASPYHAMELTPFGYLEENRV